MGKLLFAAALALTAVLIYWVTGRNRRQIEKIPEGMGILCQPPEKRYIVYALGVLTVGFVLFFGVLYILDGAPEAARGMWGLCIVVAVLTLLVTILCGNMMAKECVYFDGEKIQIEKAFRVPQTVRWDEIQTIKGSFEREISLYLSDETKILTAGAGMINYEPFCMILKQKCPKSVAEYYRSQQEHPQKWLLRYGSEYYLLAVMGILILLLYLGLLASAGEHDLFQKILQSEPSERFSALFAPICGVGSLGLLFVLTNTYVRYSPEQMILKYPLRKKRELSWRAIQRIEVVLKKKQGKETWEKLRLFTDEGVYKIDLERLTHGKDGFMTMLFQMIEKYEISCTAVKR